MKKNKSDMSYIEKLHQTGRTFTLIILCLIALVPVVYCISAVVSPDWAAIAGSVAFMIGYLVIGLVEAVSYAPLLGVGGQYLAFISGNISNLKLPCSLNAQTILKTEQGSEEQEIVSTIAIAVSSIVTTIIILIGLIPLAIFGGDIVKVLEPVSPYVIPAIFGGLGLVLIAKFFKQTMIPFGIMLLICLVTFLIGVDLGQSTMLTGGMIISLIVGFILYRLDKKKNQQ